MEGLRVRDSWNLTEEQTKAIDRAQKDYEIRKKSADRLKKFELYNLWHENGRPFSRYEYEGEEYKEIFKLRGLYSPHGVTEFEETVFYFFGDTGFYPREPEHSITLKPVPLYPSFSFKTLVTSRMPAGFNLRLWEQRGFVETIYDCIRKKIPTIPIENKVNVGLESQQSLDIEASFDYQERVIKIMEDFRTRSLQLVQSVKKALAIIITRTGSAVFQAASNCQQFEAQARESIRDKKSLELALSGNFERVLRPTVERLEKTYALVDESSKLIEKMRTLIDQQIDQDRKVLEEINKTRTAKELLLKSVEEVPVDEEGLAIEAFLAEKEKAIELRLELVQATSDLRALIFLATTEDL